MKRYSNLPSALSWDRHCLLQSISPLSENVNASVTSRSNIVNNTNSISPSFPNQEIIDPYRDWIDLKTKTFTKQGDRFTDIRAVDYYSDGKTFNAIIWLFFPPRVERQNLHINS